jgi:hypothetical protein
LWFVVSFGGCRRTGITLPDTDGIATIIFNYFWGVDL